MQVDDAELNGIADIPGNVYKTPNFDELSDELVAIVNGTCTALSGRIRLYSFNNANQMGLMTINYTSQIFKPCGFQVMTPDTSSTFTSNYSSFVIDFIWQTPFYCAFIK